MPPYRTEKSMSSPTPSKGLRRNSERIREMVLFAMLAALMFCAKIALDALPNIELIGMLTILYTAVFRAKALIPIYLYITVQLLVLGFDPLVMPYIYVWAVLWGMTMLLPKKIPEWAAMIAYPVLCSLHGFAFGALCAPLTAVLLRLDFNGMLAWIAAGFGFDITHGIGNFFTGLLVFPLVQLFQKLLRQRNR